LAKKRFTDDLDNLFDAPVGQGEQSLSLFPKLTKDDGVKKEEKRSSKGFTAKLDAFLADAFEAADEQEKKEKAAIKKVKKTLSKKPRRLTGLDLLIRQTTDKPPQKRLNLAEKRRLTLAFDKAQLAQLKEIAEKEGVFLKDLINQLIERYLKERDN
jgi:hypothetical protein